MKSRLTKRWFTFFVLAALLVSMVCFTPIQAADKIELRYYTWDDATGIQFINQVVKNFTAKHPNISVKVESASYGDYWQKLQIMIASQTAPDIFQINPDFLAVFAAKGALLDLNTFIAEDKTFSIQDYYPEIIKAHQIKEQLFVLPRDVAPSVLFYNETLFKEAGLKTPYEYFKEDQWNWDIFLQAAQKITKPEIQQYGIAFETMWHRALQWVWQNGGEAFDSVDNPTECLLNMKSSYEGYQFAADLINLYHVSPSPRLTKTQSSTELFITGKVAMDINGAWMIPSYKNIKDFKWDIAPLPKGMRWGDVTGGSGPAIYKFSKHPKEAWEVAKALAGVEAQSLFAEAGYIVPTMKTVFNSQKFLTSDSLPRNKDCFLEVQEYAKIPVLTDKYMEIDNIIQKQLDLVWLGEQTAKEAMDKVVPEINKILTQ